MLVAKHGNFQAIRSGRFVHLVEPYSTLTPTKPNRKATFSGHTESVYSIAFSPDGAMIASGSHDQTVILWDAATGRKKQTLCGHSGIISSVAFSPDGRTIASGSEDKTVILWDVMSGQKKQILSGHTGAVYSVAFSPDGSTIASGSDDKALVLWEVTSGQKKETFTSHTGAISSVAFSPDGSTIASGSSDKAVIVWNVESGHKKWTFSGHTRTVQSIAFSPDGSRIASGSEDKTVILWDVVLGQKKQTLSGHTSYVLSIGFSPDGSTIASGSYDNTVMLWDVVSGQKKETLAGHTGYVTSVAFSPDGSSIASGSSDKSVILWDSSSARKVSSYGPFPAVIEAVSFDSNTGNLNVTDSHRVTHLAMLPSKTRTKLLQAIPDLASSVLPATDRSLIDTAFGVTEQYCTLKFVARLIPLAQCRVAELEASPESLHLRNTPLMAKALEVGRQAQVLKAAGGKLADLLRRSTVDYSQPVELESRLALRDEARRDVVAQWNEVTTLASQLESSIAAIDSFNASDPVLLPDQVTPRNILSAIESERLTVLKDCLARVLDLMNNFIHRLRSDPSDALSPYDSFQGEYAAALELDDALRQASIEQLQVEYAQRIERLHKERDVIFQHANDVLVEVRSLQNLQAKTEVDRITSITVKFPFGPDGTPPRTMVGTLVRDIHTKYVVKIKTLRHEITVASSSYDLYATIDPELAETHRQKEQEYELKLLEITKQFTTVYDEEVMEIREAFPELEDYIRTEIDPFCGRSNFRWDLALTDFDLTPLHVDSVLRAETKPASRTLKGLEPLYILKRFSEKATLFQELAAMRSAKSDGQHHENVAEAKFAFEQKEVSGTTYFLGMPFYCCDAPSWFVARINAREPSALVQAMAGMARGLACLHRNGIIHGDVKPDNLRFDSEGVSGVPKWIDFNFCANRGSTLKVWGMKTVLAVGRSVGFTSPEQEQHGILAPAGDVYSLGKTFAALLFLPGHPPWEAQSPQGGPSSPCLASEVADLFGPANLDLIVNRIKEMTLVDEGRRISLLEDTPTPSGAPFLSVMSRLEALRHTLK